jgi:Ca2+-dependent lipid-binding protein
MGKMDPYIIITHKGKKYKTPSVNEAGKTPVWNYTIPESFMFAANETTGNEDFHIRCLDDDYGRDDDVGEATFKLTDFIAKDFKTGVSGKWFTLMFTSDAKKNTSETAGEIQIDTTWVPN